MRVLYFSQGYSPHDHRFLSALEETEHEVYYLRLEGNPRQVEDRPVPSQIRQVQWAGGSGNFHWRNVPRLTIDLMRVIREIKPSLIHAGPIQTCAFLSALTGFRPLLTMSWGFDLMQDAERNRWWRWITSYTLRHSTFFVSDARITHDRAIGYGMDPDGTAVFPWGVDLKQFSPRYAVDDQTPPDAQSKESPSKSAKSQRAPGPPFVLLCNRSWEPRYGVDILAKAFVQVAQEREDVCLLLLGSGSQAHLIRQILMKGQVLDRVQFGGRIAQTELPRWYHMAHLYISPSHIDGSSVSLMEALACGLPVLVSDIPANREWVTENINGWLFTDGDACALANKILAAMNWRKNLRDVSHAARKLAEERADWQRNFAVLLDVYNRSVEVNDRRRSG